jgi:hypothetical protein
MIFRPPRTLRVSTAGRGLVNHLPRGRRAGAYARRRLRPAGVIPRRDRANAASLIAARALETTRIPRDNGSKQIRRAVMGNLLSD